MLRHGYCEMQVSKTLICSSQEHTSLSYDEFNTVHNTYNAIHINGVSGLQLINDFLCLCFFVSVFFQISVLVLPSAFLISHIYFFHNRLFLDFYITALVPVPVAFKQFSQFIC